MDGPFRIFGGAPGASPELSTTLAVKGAPRPLATRRHGPHEPEKETEHWNLKYDTLHFHAAFENLPKTLLLQEGRGSDFENPEESSHEKHLSNGFMIAGADDALKRLGMKPKPKPRGVKEVKRKTDQEPQRTTASGPRNLSRHHRNHPTIP